MLVAARSQWEVTSIQSKLTESRTEIIIILIIIIMIIIIIKYQELKREIKHLWSVKKIEVVPVVIGALGSVSKEFGLWIKKIGINVKVEQVQKTDTSRNGKNSQESTKELDITVAP